MSQKSRNRDRIHAVLCVAFGVVLTMAGGIGAAGAADDTDNPADGNWVRGLYRKFGEKAGAPVGGDYRERPPLVVPPTRDLPPPGTPTTLTQRNPAWPVDRDEARRKAGGTARAERRPASLESERQASSVEPVGVGQETAKGSNDAGAANGFWNKFLGTKQQPESTIFAREPPRTSLVDPPRGYRTPSPAQPYGLSNPDTADTLQKAPLRTGKPDNENR